ncbi:MAG: TOBE domain-containing protein, partial [Armatimonadota bacterium]|nr:TOBE domain-containing protein [Armatimonadota bacterium]
NFIEARLARRNGGVVLDAGSFAMEVPADLVPHVQEWVGRQVIFGIRPEDIQDRAYARDANHAWALRAMVEVHEPLGSDVILYLSSGDHSIVARVDAHSQARMGQEAEVVFNLRKMHLFDPQTHAAIV